MKQDVSSVPAEGGVVAIWVAEQGYGFVTPDSGGRNVFFHITTLMEANLGTVAVGARVMFVRGVLRKDKPGVVQFVEVNGKPTTPGRYGKVNGRFVLLAEGEELHAEPQEAVANKAEASGVIESGVVESFTKNRSFGFITLDDGGSKLFFFIIELMKANRDDIDPGTRVSFVRGTAKDGRPKVGRFVEIGGEPVTVGSYSLVSGRFVFHRNDKHPPAQPQVVMPVKVEIRESKHEPQPAPAQSQASVIDENEWLTVTLRKLRQGHTTYADSETLGQIIVPWPVLQEAKITSSRNEERFELRCQPGDDLPVAHEIRRY